eukprot:GHVN01039762.1.p1 GENE.GHVN01039762.1~~GHVN01039762.1.p1  ORF type:complete len:182 (-),score=70.18 GHVN01039762.1:49-594(-)
MRSDSLVASSCDTAYLAVRSLNSLGWSEWSHFTLLTWSPAKDPTTASHVKGCFRADATNEASDVRDVGKVSEMRDVREVREVSHQQRSGGVTVWGGGHQPRDIPWSGDGADVGRVIAGHGTGMVSEAHQAIVSSIDTTSKWSHDDEGVMNEVVSEVVRDAERGGVREGGRLWWRARWTEGE